MKLKGNSHCTWVVKHQLTYLIVWLVTFYTALATLLAAVPCPEKCSAQDRESADGDTLSDGGERGWEIAIDECDTPGCVCFEVKINIFAQPKKQIIKQMHFEILLCFLWLLTAPYRNGATFCR